LNKFIVTRLYTSHLKVNAFTFSSRDLRLVQSFIAAVRIWTYGSSWAFDKYLILMPLNGKTNRRRVRR